MNLSVSIRYAYHRGYRVTRSGKLLGLKKRPLMLAVRGTQRYPSFSINIEGKIQSIPAHKMAAYCFYGEKSLRNGVVVRHVKRKNILDISRTNIRIGSHSQNNLDKPKMLRIRAARLARAAQPIEGTTAKLTAADVRKVRSFYDQYKGRKPPNGSVASLAMALGVNRNALACIKSGQTWSHI